MESINVFKKFPGCISDRTKLRGILADFFPAERVKVNLIMNAYDEGIVEEIEKTNELDLFMFSRWKSIVQDNYGISEENADWVIDYWFTEYGTKVCGKSYQKPDTHEVRRTHLSSVEIKRKAPMTNMIIDIAKLNEGEKIPKEIIEINTDVSRDVNITSLNCAVRKDYQYDDRAIFKFTGEYEGKSNRYVLIIMMIYNANNELIGYEDDVTIDEEFQGQATFSETVQVPGDEYISRIVLKMILDPAFGY